MQPSVVLGRTLPKNSKRNLTPTFTSPKKHVHHSRQQLTPIHRAAKGKENSCFNGESSFPESKHTSVTDVSNLANETPSFCMLRTPPSKRKHTSILRNSAKSVKICPPKLSTQKTSPLSSLSFPCSPIQSQVSPMVAKPSNSPLAVSPTSGSPFQSYTSPFQDGSFQQLSFEDITSYDQVVQDQLLMLKELEMARDLLRTVREENKLLKEESELLTFQHEKEKAQLVSEISELRQALAMLEHEHVLSLKKRDSQDIKYLQNDFVKLHQPRAIPTLQQHEALKTEISTLRKQCKSVQELLEAEQKEKLELEVQMINKVHASQEMESAIVELRRKVRALEEAPYTGSRISIAANPFKEQLRKGLTAQCVSRGGGTRKIHLFTDQHLTKLLWHKNGKKGAVVDVALSDVLEVLAGKASKRLQKKAKNYDESQCLVLLLRKKTLHIVVPNETLCRQWFAMIRTLTVY